MKSGHSATQRKRTLTKPICQTLLVIILTWTSLDADSKLICNWFVGGRDAEYANIFMQDLAERLDNRVQPTTDGHKAYLQAVDGAFGNYIDYAQLVKFYGNSPNGATTRYSPAECTGIKKTDRTGSPDSKMYQRHMLSAKI